MSPDSHLMNTDGQRTQDTQRIQEGPQAEAMGQRVWQPEACASSGEASGEPNSKGISRIIKLENSLQVKDPIRMKADTTREIQETLCSLYPIDISFIGMLFSTSPDGVMHRKFIEGPLPSSEPTIYVKLYLKKHPPLH